MSYEQILVTRSRRAHNRAATLGSLWTPVSEKLKTLRVSVVGVAGSSPWRRRILALAMVARLRVRALLLAALACCASARPQRQRHEGIYECYLLGSACAACTHEEIQASCPHTLSLRSFSLHPRTQRKLAKRRAITRPLSVSSRGPAQRMWSLLGWK